MSSNRAWMPLHIDTYLADTGYLTAAEHGAYMLLIMTYWRDGGLPEDERLIARIARMSKDEWADSRDVLASFFKDGWRHSRIDEELAKADEIIEKRRNAALGRHSKSKADASAVQVQCKSSDTGVPPRTYNQDTPPTPPPGEARALFSDLFEAYPASDHSHVAKAERLFGRLAPADQHVAVSQARLEAIASVDDRRKRGRDAKHHAQFVKGLDAWLREGRWKPDTPAANPMGDLALIKPDSPDFEIIKAFLGDRLVLSKSGNATVLVADLEQARAAA